jgi:hypothetical protein
LQENRPRSTTFRQIQTQEFKQFLLSVKFKRANRALRTLKTYLGRVIRDIARKIDGDHGLEGTALDLALLFAATKATYNGAQNDSENCTCSNAKSASMGRDWPPTKTPCRIAEAVGSHERNATAARSC